MAEVRVKSPFRCAAVHWLDAYSEDGWTDFDDAALVRAEHPVFTQGWVIHETERYVVLAATISPDPRKPGNWQISGAMGIPKGCILSRFDVDESQEAVDRPA